MDLTMITLDFIDLNDVFQHKVGAPDPPAPDPS